MDRHAMEVKWLVTERMTIYIEKILAAELAGINPGWIAVFW